MVAAPEAKQTTLVEMKTDEKNDIAEQKTKEIEKIKEDVTPEGSKDVSAEADNSEKIEKANEKFAAGKKALLQNLFQEAVDHLNVACSLMSSVHGDMSPKMCEFYFYYGKALLELARIEEGVLGNALTGVPDGDDMENSQVEDPDKMTEEERESVAQQVDEALEENFKTTESLKEKSDDKESTEKSEDEESKEEKSDKVEQSNDKESKEEKSDKVEQSEEKESKEEKSDKVEQSEDKKSNGAKSEDTVEKMEESTEGTNGTSEETKSEEKSEDEKENEGDEEGEEAEGEEVEGEDTAETEGEEQASQDGEDVSSLQLSWEVLQLAKTIYEKNESRTKDEDLKLSQVYLKLGEVSLENETYNDSIEMNSECLKLQEANLSTDDRCLAETHYQLGLAHSFANNFEDSIKHYESAISVIKMRMKNDTEKLEKDEVKITDDLDETKLTDEQKSTVTDFKELQKLLPQLEEKITDIKETKASFAEKLKAMKNHLVGEISGASSSTSTGFGESSSSDAKPISTSMIRKKRKPEEESSDEKESKKAKTSISNGDSDKKEDAEKEEEKMDTDKKSDS